MGKEIIIIGAVVDFQTSGADDAALMRTHLLIKNGKLLSKEQIEKVIKVSGGF